MRERLIRLLLCCAMVAAALGSAFFGWLYYAFYWAHRGQFNEAGRYFDAQAAVVYHEQDQVLVFPALALLAVALLFLRLWWARSRVVGG